MARKSNTLALILGIAAAACGSENSDSEGEKQLEIFSWFVAGSEKQALDALLDEVREAQPGINIVNSAQHDSTTARYTTLPRRMADGIPPDSFQAIAGADLQLWMDKDGLEPLDVGTIVGPDTSVFPADVLDSVSDGVGNVYAVPQNIERNNTLFYNKTLVAAAGLNPETDLSTIDGIFSAADKLKTLHSEPGFSPISVSNKDGWTMGLALFDAILVASAGPDFVSRYWAGRELANAQPIRDAASVVGDLLDYANEDRNTTTWTDSVARLCRGDSALLFLPDFVKGEFEAQGCVDDIDYVALEPADKTTFVFASVVWTLPVNAPHRSMALEFLKAAASTDGQRNFNKPKGSIPARTTGVDITEFDRISQKTYGHYTTAETRIRAIYAQVPPAFQEPVDKAVRTFCDASVAATYRNVDALVTVLEQYYPLLQQ